MRMTPQLTREYERPVRIVGTPEAGADGCRASGRRPFIGWSSQESPNESIAHPPVAPPQFGPVFGGSESTCRFVMLSGRRRSRGGANPIAKSSSAVGDGVAVRFRAKELVE